MATGKRYYWIKLRDTFMTSDAVDFLMGQPDGANYVVLYQMLCLKTINTDGKLERHIGEVIIPYDEAKIQRDCKWFSIDTVRIALNLYKALGLIYADKDGCLCLTDHEKMVGSSTDYADQKRIQRQNAPQLPPVDNVHTKVHEDVHTDNRDKDIRDKDTKDNNNNTVQYSTVNNSTDNNTVLESALTDFVEHRKAMKRPLTDKGVDLIREDLEKLAPGDVEKQVAILNQSIKRGWQGVFPLKEEKKGPPIKSSYDNLPPKRDDKDDLERLAIMMGVDNGG